ncbi:apolipoprotein F [Lacerta agilis]|uniref:apolipoprotein F n=1 Tax=Lacerta agilis TaxID=80427 RepID=UPI00141937F6|nr:apolipoprotein F [Lacerta agilis]
MVVPPLKTGLPKNLYNMYLPSLPPKAFLTFFGFLFLCHGSEGGLLPMANPGGNASEDHPPASNATSDPLRIFLSSISPKSPHLPEKGVSCEDLVPEALEGFAKLRKQPQTLIRAALALTLQRAGCSWHAETLILRLYKELGQKDTDDLLFAMAGTLNTTRSPGQRKSSAALRFFLGLQAPRRVRHCQDLVPVNGSFLHGKAYRVYRGFGVASRACYHLRDYCAGVSSNGSSLFRVVAREGSYLLPQRGAYSWLRRCQGPARYQRSTRDDCASETEQQVHAVVNWIPGVSTFYNLGTTIYFAAKDCKELAEERGIDTLVDVGQDTLFAVTGGAGSVFGMGISAALKPAVRSGVHSLIRYFREKDEPYPVPPNHSGPVTVI